MELAAGRVTRYTLLIYLTGGFNSPDIVQYSRRIAAGASQQASPGSSSAGGTRNAKAAKQQGRGKSAQSGSKSGKSSNQQQQQVTAAQALACLPLQGGETVFYDKRRVVARIAPVAGLALCHLHGEFHCLEHEALPVQQGLKYVLRSDVVFAAPGLAA